MFTYDWGEMRWIITMVKLIFIGNLLFIRPYSKYSKWFDFI